MPVPNMVCGRMAEPAEVGLRAASKRSAAEPWRSPLLFFLKAYWTTMERLQRNCEFMHSMARSAASKLSNATKPKPCGGQGHAKEAGSTSARRPGNERRAARRRVH